MKDITDSASAAAQRETQVTKQSRRCTIDCESVEGGGRRRAMGMWRMKNALTS